MDTVEVVTSQGRFSAAVSGPTDGPLVVLLHGFPQSRHTWREQIPWLAAHGYRVVAPDGRGYSAGVRPDPATHLAEYGLSRLVDDVLEIADASGAASLRFHLVGHDWGGQVAWTVAERHPDRVASLTVLSRPHPAAFQRAVRADADGQRDRSRHHARFHDPATASLLLDDGARRLRASLSSSGVPDDHVDEYLGVVGHPAALDAALAWYRAAGQLADHTVGPVGVPTLYLWGDADATVGPTAARTTQEFVHGAYRFVPLPGIGHFITDQAPDVVNRHVLAHLEAHPAARHRLVGSRRGTVSRW